MPANFITIPLPEQQTVESENQAVFSIFKNAKGEFVHYFLKDDEVLKIVELLNEKFNTEEHILINNTNKTSVKKEKENNAELSYKEKEALELLAKGFSYKMIAIKLNKSVETIRVQLKNAYKKLNVHSNTEAVIKMMQARSSE